MALREISAHCRPSRERTAIIDWRLKCHSQQPGCLSVYVIFALQSNTTLMCEKNTL